MLLSKFFYFLVVAGILSSTAISAQAALMTYHFNGMVESGLLLGETYDGHLSFDSVGLTRSGAESVGLTDLSFTVLSATYRLGDGIFPASAYFLDGVFIGTHYTVATTDVVFSLVAAAGTGLPDDRPYFAYDTTAGDAGTGSLIFVNEPASFALFAIGLAGLAVKRRRQTR